MKEGEYSVEQGGPLFNPGQIVMTHGAAETLERHEVNPFSLILRHLVGDWGDLDEEDKAENDRALIYGDRLFSSYKLDEQEKIWCITEWDRSATTLLRPDEY